MTSSSDAIETSCERPAAGHAVLRPLQQRLPLVLASPHSGRDYPADFLKASRLDSLALRRSEDSFVEEIFAGAPGLGAPLLHALFPRAFVDPNREPYELDPAMFVDKLPHYVNTRSPRVAAGLGTIARVVASGADIYRDKLAFSDAVERIRRHYWPYHRTLRKLVEDTQARFGYCLLIDCHSMPSSTATSAAQAAASIGASGREVEIVLGNCHGASCAPEIIETAARLLAARGYRVARNAPYSGGFVTRHYGRPAEGRHALQIEINRALYMNEQTIERTPGIEKLTADMTHLVAGLGALRLDSAPPLAAE